VRDWRSAPLEPVEGVLCDFAVKLTRQPEAVEREDLDRLREHGLGDREIHDAVQVIAYFNYITRIADGLGVEPEDFIRPWESGG
jgi:uncharacterized peroxidase-related enzyme